MYFSNKNINFLNLHVVFQRFSNNILDVFSAVFLLGLGVPFPVVALVWAGSCILRSILRPLSLLLSEKIGLKRALISGVIIGSGIFFVLSKITGFNNWLYFYIFYSALCDITYWLPFHSYNAIAGDADRRGKQIGVQLGFATVAKMVAPIIGSLIIVHYGFSYLYLLGAVIALLSAIPLFVIRDISPGKLLPFREAMKTIDKKGMIMMMGDGILFTNAFLWTITLFYIVGDYVTFGWLVAFQLFSSAILSVLLGGSIDRGNGKRIAYIGLLSIGAVILLRAFFVQTIPQIIAVDVLLALGFVFYSDSFNVGLYNLAKRTKNTLWFHFFGELGWDMGAASALILSAVFFSAGVPLRFVIVFSAIGLLVVFSVLKKFYLNKTFES